MAETTDLLEWYLATLRRAAQADTARTNLTPMSFLKTDQELVRTIVSSDSSPSPADQSAGGLKSGFPVWVFFAVLTVIGTLALIVATVILPR